MILAETYDMKEKLKLFLVVSIVKVFILFLCIKGINHCLYIIQHDIGLSNLVSMEFGRKHTAVNSIRVSDGIQGMDVAHYQKTISWAKVPSAGIHFAFIKATEGNTMKDSKFDDNWSGIGKTNIRKGAYHFFLPKKCPKKQFANFMATVQLQKGDMVPLLDVERTQGLPSSQIRIKVQSWLDLAEEHYGVKPLIYTTQRFYNTHFKNYFKEYEFVMARYNSRPPYLLDSREVKFWQFTDKGLITGVSTFVDRQVFLGTLSEFEAYLITKG